MSTAAGVVGAVAGVMQWLTSAGAWAVVAVGLAGLAAACWALGWLWMQRRPALATVVVMISEQLRTNQSFCVRTTEKRWAWLTVKRYEPRQTLTFDVIVW
ncbi:hypothetical protein RM555_07440 [Micromonospora sp. DSM 115977]|uniref:PH domain-containing protein n=1 Tax=Micromonospora reichwaldensis TaxID=3075516 RepID=A0ABU2WU09_9ACTN|nr:hypothetical protein [Micromonospora sp. DSM 115977]MDT0528821.1 hypothetical protein [Micromonospora sp. DSM 115977]